MLRPILMAAALTAAVPTAAGTVLRIDREFDPLGRLAKESRSDGGWIAYRYDPNGNRTEARDDQGRVTAYEYDALNRLKKLTDAAGGITRYTYDGRNRLVTVTDPRGLVTKYEYNGFDDLLKQTSPDSGTTTWVPRADGQPASTTDNLGQTTQYTYDTAGRVIKTAYADGTALLYAYGKAGSGSATGKLTAILDGASVRQFAFGYDALGRRNLDNRRLRDKEYLIRYAYDAKGLLNQLTYPSGRIVTYSYDTQGRPLGIQTKQGTAPGVTLLSQIAYQPFGPAKGWTYGNGEVRSASYDQNGRMTSLTLGDSTLSLSYDTGGRLVEQQMAGGWWDRLLQRLGLPVGQTDLFDYDKLDRLTAWQADGQTRLYDYDATGNRTRIQTSSITHDQTIDPASNRLIAGAGVYQYDANGNRVTDSRQSYRYDVRGRLIEAGGAQYTVNAFGERVIKTYQGQTTLYHYDQWGRLLAETDAQGATRREYVYLDTLPVGVIDFGTEIRYIHTDHLGTPRLVTDAAKQAIWAWRGEPFGATAADEDPTGSNAPYAFNLRFPGQYFDKETGLHYNYHRDYDPQVGRYIQTDPIGLAGGINTYAYVSNNPLSGIDPKGLDCVAANGTVTCGGPGQPTVSFPRPPGWPSTITSNSPGYHKYDVRVKMNGVDANCVMQGMINTPTPGSPAPATPWGTANNATPSTPQSMFDALDYVSSFGNDRGATTTVLLSLTY
ncbi:RHS repeat-associated core domain-containing protein [Chitinimonas koreensis]|uniref:RHS repeat-associated core domain-containing protein n=1 Tax=Chitinimonas koreensis TaxID=356302 RepID=UPI001653FF05|nr:RHS repeat-associated core domain-containing protein [Chitinimonas koreensis]QNM96747.1 RHS repeat protein [Chitinimonas koreensis]